jgi:hypothetical protein
MDRATRDLMEANFAHIKENISDLKLTMRDVQSTLSRHEETLLRNTITVEDHKRRSDLSDAKHDEFIRTQRAMLGSIQELTAKVSHVEVEFNAKLDMVERDLVPIKAHVKSVKKLMRLLLIIDENKWTIAKILGFIIVVAFTVYMGSMDIGSFFR